MNDRLWQCESCHYEGYEFKYYTDTVQYKLHGEFPRREEWEVLLRVVCPRCSASALVPVIKDGEKCKIDRNRNGHVLVTSNCND